MTRERQTTAENRSESGPVDEAERDPENSLCADCQQDRDYCPDCYQGCRYISPDVYEGDGDYVR